MPEVIIPDFGQLLATHLSQIPADAMPGALALLERGAAERYRGWAKAVPEHAEGLLACAAREDEIADTVEAMLPVPPEHRALVERIIPLAMQTYLDVFNGLSPTEQMTIQADAERQGANAWQGFIEGNPDQAEALNALSAIERESADYLDQLLASGT